MASDDITLPTAPEDLPKYLREGLLKQSPERLRRIAIYAEELAAAKERQNKTQEDDEDTIENQNQDENTPDGVPKRATKTVKTINDNRYWYWQWREGEKIKSEYIGPVNPSN